MWTWYGALSGRRCNIHRFGGMRNDKNFNRGIRDKNSATGARFVHFDPKDV